MSTLEEPLIKLDIYQKYFEAISDVHTFNV